MREIIEEQDRTINSLLETIRIKNQLMSCQDAKIEELEDQLYQCEKLLRESREEKRFYTNAVFGRE